jgi:hypothetical protein
VGCFVEEAGSWGAGAGEPVEGDVGEEVVAVGCLVWGGDGRVGPGLELFGDPGELADWGVGEGCGDCSGRWDWSSR